MLPPPPFHKHEWRGSANPQDLLRLTWPEREESFSKGTLSPRFLAFQCVLCSIICCSRDKVPRRREGLPQQPGPLSGCSSITVSLEWVAGKLGSLPKSTSPSTACPPLSEAHAALGESSHLGSVLGVGVP